jgi:SAM-dependent methyltransferase
MSSEFVDPKGRCKGAKGHCKGAKGRSKDPKGRYKDLFSGQSTDYAKFRPRYPDALFRYLASLVDQRDTVWDCGTGNGQAALKLTEHFAKVIATDPSEKQLASAEKNPRIEYRIAPAEASGLPDRSVDLITAAQAFHWFKQDEFFTEARRVLKPHGALAIWCYELAKITPEIDAVVHRLYKGILGPYWEKERQLVEEGYKHVHIPGHEITPPKFEMNAVWSLEHLIGYLSTWSALQTYLKKNGDNPLEKIYPDLKSAWGGEITLPVSWDLGLRVGRNESEKA